MGYRFLPFAFTKRIKKDIQGKIMGKYIIILDGEKENMLIEGAKSRDITAQQFITDIVNRYLPLMHMINREDMAKGYEDMADINLELAK
ncbi:MAG: hypothetical protein J1F36_04215 [Clostridiales bacterium]|nr:hypothetical protein [Clostridiales bacterium]